MKIRKYKNGDEIGIMKLDRMVEEHPWNRRNLKNWFWKYKGNNPAGRSLVWVAEINRKIVGTFSIIPMNYKIGSKYFKGSNSIAMIIHPKWQNKGLIKYVSDKLFEDAKVKKLKFVYGYPNQNAYELHKRVFNYKDINNQNLFYKKLKSFKQNKLSCEVKKILYFDKSFNLLWKKLSRQYDVINERNSNFLNWRYLSRPDHKYYCFKFTNKNKILGYVVLKIYRFNKIKTGHFIDIFCNQFSKSIFKDMIEFGCKFFNEQGCKDVSLWIQGSQNLEKKILNMKFKIKSTRPFICKLFEKNLYLKKKLNKRKWYFNMGDSLEIY